MLNGLIHDASATLCLDGCATTPAAAGSRPPEAATTPQPPRRQAHGVRHQQDWRLVEWLLLAVIWSGTLLLLSRTVVGLVLTA